MILTGASRHQCITQPLRLWWFLFLLISAAGSALAESRGIFWEVRSGAGVAWVLGSVHMANDDFYPLRPEIESAFERSPVLLVEMDDQRLALAEQQKILQETIMLPAGTTLSSVVSPDTLKQIETTARELGMTMAMLEPFRPNFVAIMLASNQALSLGYSPELGIDAVLLAKARGSKQIEEVETFREQMELLAHLPADDLSLQESLATLKESEVFWRRMEAAWKAGDEQALYDAAIGEPLAETPELTPYYEALFFKRNRRMADATAACVQQHRECFVVVGAGHVSGPGSVITYLREAGFEATRP